MDFVIAQPAQAFVPVKGSKAAFPVHRIYCVGRNYAAHAIEMGGDPDRDPPFFFQKNPDNLVLDGCVSLSHGLKGCSSRNRNGRCAEKRRQ